MSFSTNSNEEAHGQAFFISPQHMSSLLTRNKTKIDLKLNFRSIVKINFRFLSLDFDFTFIHETKPLCHLGTKNKILFWRVTTPITFNFGTDVPMGPYYVIDLLVL